MRRLRAYQRFAKCVAFNIFPFCRVLHAGIYDFAFEDGSKVRGRYPFVYAYEDGEWRIAHQHSSIMTEPAVATMNKVKETKRTIVNVQEPTAVGQT